MTFMKKSNKTCSICGEVKDINDFFRKRDTKDGHTSACKLCISKKRKEERENNKEKFVLRNHENYVKKKEKWLKTSAIASIEREGGKDEIPKKICSICGMEKDITEYHRKADERDGHKKICKICASKKGKEYRKDNPERYTRWDHEHYLKRKESCLKKISSSLVEAVTNGITRKTCSICGEEKDVGDFYSKPDTSDGLSTICKKCKLTKDKDYRNKNAEKYCLRQRTKYAKYKHKYKSRQQQYYIENKEKIKANVKEYCRTPAGKHSKAKSYHKRKSRILQSPCTLTNEQWEKILAIQDYKCAICGKTFNKLRRATRDHIIPVSKGGGLTFENIQALCPSCNSSKQDKIDTSKIISWLDFE